MESKFFYKTVRIEKSHHHRMK
ncbi:Protein of unknown function [Lactobacillus helveticus CIRM-BIA 101]|uniref:Uncharacterized protein n=1 Tax=Lactobacillus helveticus CIRM-BIA 104 TaxID=1226333 RepID=U6FB87_LACHE|nr:Protein of unknown function [Lactobacillus helveticus CIRM-BIA 104]CDI62800.1 Protein of unknown function [Lactobacillus helveticus CIRM-BIA 103]CDI64589.1 Protein of unknown function [Lactobacillus helveticus CIRM-BIA 101]